MHIRLLIINKIRILFSFTIDNAWIILLEENILRDLETT